MGSDETTVIRPGEPAPRPGRSTPADGRLTDELVETSVWTDELLSASGIPVRQAPLVSVGGGFGSFVLTDLLRMAGVPRSSIRVLSNLGGPEETYRYLARNSQIPDHERLRSDSSSCPDNFWGFPSYAWRESASAKGLRAKLRPLWQVLTEPVLSDYFTPRAGQVYETTAREAERIGWADMVISGQVRMVRRHADGGYVTVLTPAGETGGRRLAVRSTHVHVAVGYPGVKFLPDLQAYRERHSDFSRVVNAYEPHDGVYEELRRRPSTVVVRGSGIVASRILQRLLDDRERHGVQTTVIHLFRNYVDGPQGDSATFRRPGGNGFAHQAFNYPKSSFGGQLADQLAALDGPARAELLGRMGGTNTPDRADWRAQLVRARAEKAYRQVVGRVREVRPGPDQTVVTEVTTPEGVLELAANVIIDATGLESDISEHRVLGDLLEHGGAGRNDLGRLDVEPTFEIRGTRSGPGRMYASGSITLGGYYAVVDSFLGLQYAALRIADDLASVGFGRRIGVLRSVGEWWRWVRHRPIPDVEGQP